MLGEAGHVVDDGGEVGGTIQPHGAQRCVVGLYHPGHPRTVGVFWVAVQSKLMADLVRGND